MLNDTIVQKVLAEISESHQNALVNSTKNVSRVRSDPEYLELDRECRTLVLKIAQFKNQNQDTSILEEQFRVVLNSRNKVIESMGLSIQDLSPKYSCSICEDTGYSGGSYCKCFIKNYNQKLMKQSGLDFKEIPSLKEYDFSRFSGEDLEKIKKIVNIAEVYINKFENLKIKNMLICGAVGVGKTYLSKIIAKEVFNKNNSVLFISAFSLCNNFSQVEFKAQEKAKYLDYLSHIDLLVIDDLGAQNINKFSLQDLLALINERIENKKNTLITTNLTPVDLKNTFGERLFSRLNDKKEFSVINITGKDLRINLN